VIETAVACLRQMFEAGCLRSAFWHRFSLTAWSPIAARPAAFGITVPHSPRRPFSNYVLEYDEPGAVDHAAFGPPLRRAVEHYMLGAGLDLPMAHWLGADAPRPALAPDFVRRAVKDR
jgi:hypothetical protein